MLFFHKVAMIDVVYNNAGENLPYANNVALASVDNEGKELVYLLSQEGDSSSPWIIEQTGDPDLTDMETYFDVMVETILDSPASGNIKGFKLRDTSTDYACRSELLPQELVDRNNWCPIPAAVNSDSDEPVTPLMITRIDTQSDVCELSYFDDADPLQWKHCLTATRVPSCADIFDIVYVDKQKNITALAGNVSNNACVNPVSFWRC